MKTPLQIWDEFGAIPNQDMKDYRDLLRKLGAGNVLEIGVCGGVSTAAFLLGMEDKNDGQLFSVDIEDCLIFDHPRWTFIQGDSRTVQIPAIPYNVILIDGDHSYVAVKNDLERFSSMLAPTGVLLAHDVSPSPEWIDRCRQWYDVDGCSRAWQEFVSSKGGFSTIKPGMTGMGIWCPGKPTI